MASFATNIILSKNSRIEKSNAGASSHKNQRMFFSLCI